VLSSGKAQWVVVVTVLAVRVMQVTVPLTYEVLFTNSWRNFLVGVLAALPFTGLDLLWGTGSGFDREDVLEGEVSLSEPRYRNLRIGGFELQPVRQPSSRRCGRDKAGGR